MNRKFLSFLGCLSSLILHPASLSAQSATPPSWWSEYGVTDSSLIPDDSAAATVGQAKYVAFQANAYFDSVLAPVGGSGSAIGSVITAPWFTDTTNDNQVLLIGQLKYLAAPFYDRLNSDDVLFDTTEMVSGDASYYPWLEPPSNATIDTQLASLGQLKFAFFFDLSAWVPPDPQYIDTDNDGLDDEWEQRIIDYLETIGYTGLTLADIVPYDLTPGDTSDNYLWDADGDGVSNLDEYANGDDPIDFYNGEIPDESIPPAAPANFQATLLEDGRIQYTWDDMSDNEREFIIRRENHDGVLEVIARVPPNVTSVIVDPLPPAPVQP